MNYSKCVLKKGITFHKINTNKFKTNLFAIFLTTPITKEYVTKDALISAVLRRGCESFESQSLIAKELESMYGASFDCGVDKNGDNHIFKFYIESINDEFLPESNNLAQKSLDLLYKIVFRPVVKNGAFLEKFVEEEKRTLSQIILSRSDNKMRYAYERCIEETFKGQPFGLYKLGYIEDLEKITASDLYKYYCELVENCKIDVFVSGSNVDNINVESVFSDIKERDAKYVTLKNLLISDKLKEPKIVTEMADVNQANLIISADVLQLQAENIYAANVYNTILGGSANSKLFQNVREKNSLAYTAGSGFIKYKNKIIVRCGIEPQNYKSALEVIKNQFSLMKNNEFTDDEIKSAKELLYTNVQAVSDVQDFEIVYYFAQELSENFVTPDQYIEKIEKVSRADILKVANSVEFNTIYFLTNGNEINREDG